MKRPAGLLVGATETVVDRSEGVIVKASDALFGLSREFGLRGEVVSPGQIIQGAGDIVQQGDDNLLSRSGQDHESDRMVMAGE